MQVSRIVELLEKKMPVAIRGREKAKISRLAYHTDRVVPGSLFAALPGQKTDGLAFIDKAVSKGASVILFPLPSAEGISSFDSDITWLGVEDIRLALAIIADDFFGRPSESMTIVGVTGTNGKTTLTYMIESMAAAAGMDCGVIGTINYRFRTKELPAERTTPEAPDLQEILRWMADDGARMAVMEVSSHALEMRRIDGTRFDFALFTNLSWEHLDFHGDMENYYKAKGRLFKEFDIKAAIINLDDVWGRRLASELPGELVAYGQGEQCHIRSRQVDYGREGLKMIVDVPEGALDIHCPLLGLHNAQNALAAIALGWRMGLPAGSIIEGLARVKEIPGRFQKISGTGEPLVLVDYAHTPEALESLLGSARRLTAGRLIIVFGCGGDRDRRKRPLMGQAAARRADFTFITSDNPRSEAPEGIIEEIERGYLEEKKNNYRSVIDRREAINMAINRAAAADTVVIAGKGHEDYQIFGDFRIHFDDREVAREALNTIWRVRS